MGKFHPGGLLSYLGSSHPSIEITEDYVAWTKRPVTQRNNSRLQRALWPSAVFSSLWAASRHVFGLRVEKAKKIFGFETNAGNPPNPTHQSQEKTGLRNKEETVGPASDNAEERTLRSGEASHRSAITSPTSRIPGGSSISNGKNVGLPQQPVVKTQEKDVPVTLAVLAKTLARSWKPVRTEPPRGSCLVSGLVEVVGTKGKCVMDVTAVYDPSLDKYLSVNSGIRTLRSRPQRPRGGP